MKTYPTLMQTLIEVCKLLEYANIDYRVTGIVASNIYGRALSTDVIDLAVESDEAVHEVVKALNLPSSFSYDPYVHQFDDVKGFIRIQGDILSEPFIHPDIPFKVHNKALLLERLDIYGVHDPRVAEQAAFIALTLDNDKTSAYKEIWNVL